MTLEQKVFYGGQIINEQRGDLGVVVRVDEGALGAFIYDQKADEFLQL